MKEPRIVAFSGDWHGEPIPARKIINKSARVGANVIIQVGDFGFWPKHTRFHNFVSNEAKRHGIDVFFIDGNHEDHEAIESIDSRHRPGFFSVADNVFYIGRGTRWNWMNTKFIAWGGAPSVFTHVMTPGLNWFPDLEFSCDYDEEEMRQVADVLVSHDSPILPNGISSNGVRLTNVELARSNDSRRTLADIVSLSKVNYVFHGHYHVCESAYSRTLNLLITSLNMSGSPYSENMALFDCEEKRIIPFPT